MKKTPFNSGWTCEVYGKKEEVTLPHDYMVGAGRRGDSPTGPDIGFFEPGYGVYRKTFVKPESGTCLLSLDGVMGLCEVSVNRELVTFHPYGYTGFVCDLTPYLRDGDNELTVTADTRAQVSSRWYTGGGMYRDAALLTAGKTYILPNGIYVKILRLYDRAALAEVEVRIKSGTRGEGALTVKIAGEKFVRHIHAEQGENAYSFRCCLEDVDFWTPEHPVVYDCAVTLELGGECDSDEASFGVRTVETDPGRGFLLNGEPVKLYGACVHHDNGIVGAASTRAAEERRVRILKENGFNAIRTAHNPPSAVMLDVCDRLGMMVIDEIFDCWRVGKKEFDYHRFYDGYWEADTRSMVLRDRNHPAVVLWSTGNEIPEKNGTSDGYRTHKGILDVIRSLDPTRPVTHAFCTFWDNWDMEKQSQAESWLGGEVLDFWARRTMPIADLLDVSGYNYLYDRLDKDETRFPDRLIAMTESFPLDAVLCKKRMDADPRFIGEFVWTGWDYFGETGLGHVRYGQEGREYGLTSHPEHIANCGDFAVTGFKKPQSWFRDAAWELKPVTVLSADPARHGEKYAVSMWGFHDAERSWTWPGQEGKETDVFVFTLCDEAELFVNGKSVGRGAPDENGTVKFEAVYEPGTLTVRAYRGGECAGEDSICTTGAFETIGLTADRGGLTGEAELVYVEISLLDENGNVSFSAEDEVTVTAEGGQVIGTGSGRIDDGHVYASPVCRAYRGMLLAAVRPLGDEVVVTAEADGKTARIAVGKSGR